MNGILDEPAWSEGTSIPVPYERLPGNNATPRRRL